MGEMLQADLDTLHRLGGTLAGHADAIGQIKISATVTMPDSPLSNMSTQVTDAVIKAYGLIGGNIRQMSDATNTAATTYAEVDQLFAGQLRRYVRGESPR
ncbi:hypothetical protein IU500_33915 [Nocardia terpenica]|uniref:hypothetical protein n=2 Tax=Nocardia terpenica TaxID=455432 RepID=UPI001893004D|nr:hypothetical protein [Nocardia terpenica]MBF6109013.1 hypothetical protein [Nocardia terpenica]MBF6116304.1 hypothetical protein [Nocardia terpenica]MBF6123305.1 hypothetical protein [Nocardia terpenica]MBF6156512.1 hypothetical protein [Nocardia terpenica]